jgi:tetratricopeptide (TPR) repeat protein
MKKQFFLSFIIAAFIAASFACSGKPADNANDANIQQESPFANITDPAAAVAEGDRLMDENQTDLAVQAYQQAIKLNPDLAEAHFKLGIAYGLVEMQMELDGRAADTLDAKGRTRSEKAFLKAVEAYKKWLDANPNDDTAHYNLGRTYNKLNKDEEAEKEFREAVKLKPEDTEYQTELGNILIKLAKYREAIGPLKKAIELDAENERAASLLEDAEAGRQRIDYISPKNTNQANANKANSNVDANMASNSNTMVKPSNTNSKPPGPPVKPSPTPKKTKP